MKKVILFDIDYTLFDTAVFRERLYKAVALVLEKDVVTFSQDAKEIMDSMTKESGYFHPKEFSKILSRKLGIKERKIMIEKALLAADNFKDGLYKESIMVVEKLTKENKVGIFSRGYNLFQRKKIHGLTHLLEKKYIHITVDKYKSIPEIIKKYKNYKLYIVDDALGVLHAFYKLRNDVVTIWVKRGRHAIIQKPIKEFQPNVTVTSLEQIIPVIMK